MAETNQRLPGGGKVGPRPSVSEERYRVAAVARAIGILKAFSPHEPRKNAREIAHELHVQPAQVEGTLRTFEKYGLIRQIDGRYELGLAWLHLSEMRKRQFDIRQFALPTMRRIRDAIDETVILTVRKGVHRLNIDYVESTQLTRRVVQPGLELALHVGAAGRVLMSDFSQQELEHYIATVPITHHTSGKPISLHELSEDIEGVRERGYAVAIAEVTNDTAAVAAPIRNHRGEVFAALLVSIPRYRFSDGLAKACVEQVSEGVRELSSLLGYKASDTD